MTADGYLARWRGEEYEASPDGAVVRLYRDAPAAGFEEVGARRYRRLVRADEIDALGYLRTVGRWHGQPVLLLGVRGGEVFVEYLGGRAPVAVSLGLGRTDVAVYQGWVPRDEVSDVRQERIGGA